jgi:myosin protein heavy chain
MGHVRNPSLSQLSGAGLNRSDSARFRSNSTRNSTPAGTFAPPFIADDSEDAPEVRGIEGENDFSGKRYVWLRDPKTAFVRGWVVEELEEGQILVQCDDGTQQEVDAETVDKVNPAKFDKAGDMAELTHLNEPSVIHNLHMRYQADLIYVSRLRFILLEPKAYTISDIFWIVPCNNKSVLSSSHILARLHQHVQRKESRGDEAAYIRHGG